MKKENYFQVGYVARTHGVDGNLIIKTETFFPDDIEEKETVFLEIEGLPVPFFISDNGISFRNDTSIIVSFDDINTEDEAAELIGAKVLLEQNKDNNNISAQTNNDLLDGYLIVDTTIGKVGTVNSIIHFPKNSVFQLFIQEKEILIPNEQKLIENINHETKTILMSLPDGLLDIYLNS